MGIPAPESFKVFIMLGKKKKISESVPKYPFVPPYSAFPGFALVAACLHLKKRVLFTAVGSINNWHNPQKKTSNTGYMPKQNGVYNTPQNAWKLLIQNTLCICFQSAVCQLYWKLPKLQEACSKTTNAGFSFNTDCIKGLVCSLNVNQPLSIGKKQFL